MRGWMGFWWWGDSLASCCETPCLSRPGAGAPVSHVSCNFLPLSDRSWSTCTSCVSCLVSPVSHGSDGTASRVHVVAETLSWLAIVQLFDIISIIQTALATKKAVPNHPNKSLLHLNVKQFHSLIFLSNITRQIAKGMSQILLNVLSFNIRLRLKFLLRYFLSLCWANTKAKSVNEMSVHQKRNLFSQLSLASLSPALILTVKVRHLFCCRFSWSDAWKSVSFLRPFLLCLKVSWLYI